MIFGIPKEIQSYEMRVGAMPFLVKELVRRGHQVYVEIGAGEFCETPDSQYEQVGGDIVPSAEKLYSLSEVILKVREPKSVEFDLIRPDQVIFAFFHFLKNAELIKALAARGCTCLAYDFVEDDQRQQAVVRPIGRITGQMAVINGAYFLQKQNGGRGIVFGRVTGSPPAHVTILGAGNVGSQAAMTASNMGARVVVLDPDYRKLQALDSLRFPNLSTLIFSEDVIHNLLPETDLLISCVREPEKTTPRLVSPEMVKTMRRGSVIVEADIDLGGSIETGKVTTLDNPTFILDNIVHYCVLNITAGVPLIASRALSAAILPFLVQLCDLGFEDTVREDPGFAKGVSIYKGHVVKGHLAEAADLPLAVLFKKMDELNPESE